MQNTRIKRFCQAAVIDIAYYDGWEECGMPATATHTYACVHEHIVTKGTCDQHEPQPGMVGCRQCWDNGHECEMTVVVTR